MPNPLPKRKAYLYSLPTLIVPGLSHWFLGRRGRAIAFFIIVGLTFATGLALEGAIFPITVSNWLYRLAALAEVGMGLPYVVGLLAHIGKLNPGETASVMFGYGNVFIVTAGLMNMLLMMDAFDIAIGRKS